MENRENKDYKSASMSKNKGTALVTGGAVRIGRALSVALADAGYDIALHYNSSNLEAEKTANEIRKQGKDCILIKKDLSDLIQTRELIREITETVKDLVLIVNSASIFEQAEFLETEAEQFERHMNINFKAPFFISQDFARICGKGNIINILDTNIAKIGSKHFAYLLSKKALFDFTKMAARSLGPDIRVNGIAIGTTEISEDIPEGYIENNRKNLPMNRVVKILDITTTLLQILENDVLTGQCIFIDGGEQLI